jgi:hypothetical protein
MSQPTGKPIYIPPFAGVRLIEYHDRLQLVPIPDFKEVYGYGKIKASQATINIEDPNSELVWDDLGPDDAVWAVIQWFVFADGCRELGNSCFLRPECSEDDVQKRMEKMQEDCGLTREQALKMLQLYESSQEDRDFVENNFPNYQSEPDPKILDEYDLYHARLKVMAELSPKTVELLKIADITKDPEKRRYVEREAVQSYFAELAHYLTEDEVLAWQKSNPVGTGWMCEFGEVMREPRRTISPVNHELALNWLHQKYNQMTEKQLSVSIFKRILIWLTPGAIKKRRERLGLTTKRPTGPPPNSGSQ